MDVLENTGASQRRIKSRSQESLDWYERATLWFWLVVSAVFVVVLVLEFIGPAAWQTTLFWLDWVISITFLADYLLRYYMAPAKWAFVSDTWNLFDLFVVAVPFLALIVGGLGLGIFRVFRMFRLVRIARAPVVVARSAHHSRRVLHRGQGRIVLFVALATVLIAALVVWKSESAVPTAGIHSFVDAIWWAIVTMFTVGYGDLYPVTTTGRIAAFVLMLAGIALFGWLTATLASLFVESDEGAQLDNTEQQLAEVNARLERIERLLADREGDQLPLGVAAEDEGGA